MSSLYQIYWKAQVGRWQISVSTIGQLSNLSFDKYFTAPTWSDHQAGKFPSIRYTIGQIGPLTQQSHKCSPPICQIKNFITKVTEVLFLSIKSARSSLQATSSYTIQEVNLQYINLYIQRERVQHKEALTDFAQATCYSISGGIHKINAM